MSEKSVFARLSGSPTLRRTLIDAATAARDIASGAVADSAAMTHSWLFTGPPGSGRSNAARAFAAALMCTSPGEPGCGECENCRAVLSDNHPDLVHVVPRELSISVDLMRERVVSASLDYPTVAAWRVIIIEDADRLSEGAANALLKSVEEPSPRTVIMLCAPSLDPRDISVTLRSRCRHVYVPTPSLHDATRILISEGIPAEAAELAASATGGHIGRARHLATSENAQKRRARILHLAELIYLKEAAFQEVGDLVKAVEKETAAELEPVEEAEIEKVRNSFGAGVKGKGTARMTKGMETEIKALEAVHKKRRTRAQRDAYDLALVDLAGLYRDALLKASGAEIALTHPDFSGLSDDLADKNAVAALTECLEAIRLCRESFGHSVRPVVALSGLVGRLRKACGVS